MTRYYRATRPLRIDGTLCVPGDLLCLMEDGALQWVRRFSDEPVVRSLTDRMRDDGMTICDAITDGLLAEDDSVAAQPPQRKGPRPAHLRLV